MTDQSALLDFVASETDAGRLVSVPGKPNKVYWPSSTRRAGGVKVYTHLKETTADRAKSWLAIQKAGQQAREQLKRTATSAQHNAQENPMARRKARKNSHDDKHFFEQYSKGAYGAQRSVPAARRNARRNAGQVFFTKKGQPYIRTADGRAKFISRAAAAAAGARANPWFNNNSLWLPDTTQTRSSLVGAGYDWDDQTMTQSALVPGPYAWENPRGRRSRKKRKGNPMAGAAARRAQEIMRAQGCSIGTAMRAAWAEVKGLRAAANPYAPGEGGADDFDDITRDDNGPWGFGGRARGAFATRLGQFSASRTGGFQPVNRKNPRKKARKNK